MSFENKGFPNDLNSRFNSMNVENLDSDTGFIGPVQPSINTPYGPIGPVQPVGAVLPVITSDGKKLKTKKVKTGKGKAKVKSFIENIKDLLSGSASDEPLPSSVIGTKDKPTDLPEYVVETPKKSNTMKYIGIGLIAVVLVLIAYKLMKKK